MDNSGSVLAGYTQTSDFDERLTVARSGATSYSDPDGLGSITSLSNSAGAVASTYAYDSFGKLIGSAGNAMNLVMYGGREFDPETGLYYDRARYYDPTSGRFLSEDPIGLDGGLNVYRYAHNDPTTLDDPTGLNPLVGVLPWLGGLGGEGDGKPEMRTV